MERIIEGFSSWVRAAAVSRAPTDGGRQDRPKQRIGFHDAILSVQASRAKAEDGAGIVAACDLQKPGCAPT